MSWKIIREIKMFVDKCRKDNISAYAAQAAFFLLLSLIPFLMVFSSLLQYTVVSEAMLLEVVNEVMPEYIAPFMVSVIHEVYHKSVGIVSVTAVVAIWSAARGIQYTAAGLNRINDIKETRNWLFRRFYAVLYTFMFLVAIVAVMVLLVFGNSLQRILADHLVFIARVSDFLLRFRGLLMIGMMSLVFAVLYKTLPNKKEIRGRKLTIRNQFFGAVLCSVIWYFFSYAISIYVEYFNGFSMYGSLTTIVLLMLWLYFGMYIMLVCAQINLLYEEKIFSCIS